ncbi:MAG: type 4a pilus biogenesis protein PilO [Candidatus Omnitrophota bacterium]
MELADLGKYKNKIINILIIIIAVVIAVNIYKNYFVSIKGLNSQKEEEIEKNAIVERIIKLQKEFNKYKNFINNKDISGIINNINITAKDTGVKILSIKPENSRKEGIYEVYPFRASISARQYSEIGNFIGALESDPKIFIIESIDLTVQKEAIREEKQKPVENVLNANLVVSTILIK